MNPLRYYFSEAIPVSCFCIKKMNEEEEKNYCPIDLINFGVSLVFLLIRCFDLLKLPPLIWQLNFYVNLKTKTKETRNEEKPKSKEVIDYLWFCGKDKKQQYKHNTWLFIAIMPYTLFRVRFFQFFSIRKFNKSNNNNRLLLWVNSGCKKEKAKSYFHRFCFLVAKEKSLSEYARNFIGNGMDRDLS